MFRKLCRAATTVVQYPCIKNIILKIRRTKGTENTFFPSSTGRVAKENGALSGR